MHLAAQAAVPRSVEEPLFDASVNVLGTINLLDACRRTGTGRVVYVSTGGAAYGDTDVLPTPEEHPTRATSPYGVSKVAAERYLECFAGLASMTGLTLRLANVYGPRQRPDGEAGVVAIFARRLLGGQRCTIYGDGEQTRDYVYVADVAEAAELALVSAARGVVNISTGRETSVNALLRQVAAAVGVACDPEYAAARAGEVRRERAGQRPRPRAAGLAAAQSARARHRCDARVDANGHHLGRSTGLRSAVDFHSTVSISPGRTPPRLRASRNRRSKTQEVISPAGLVGRLHLAARLRSKAHTSGAQGRLVETWIALASRRAFESSIRIPLRGRGSPRAPTTGTCSRTATACGPSGGSSKRSPTAARPSWSAARAAWARISSPGRSPAPRDVPSSRSSRSTARPCRPSCWSPSCSATKRAPSPAPTSASRGSSSSPSTAPCSSTRSASFRCRCRPSCSTCCRTASSSGSADVS